MQWKEYSRNFSDEASCKAEWRRIREQEGVVCPRCGCKAHYWKSDKECFECKFCHYRQSLRANTVMHGSQLPFTYWFTAIQMLTTTKKSVSALELQRQLGHKHYRPIWAMLHKLRIVMGQRDLQYDLSGLVESNVSYFTVDTIDNTQSQPTVQDVATTKQASVAPTQASCTTKPPVDTSPKQVVDAPQTPVNTGKQAKSRWKKVKVMVIAETHQRTAGSRPKKKSDKPTSVNYVKMFIVEDMNEAAIKAKIGKSVSPSAVIISDKSRFPTDLSAVAMEHRLIKLPKAAVKKLLPWVHIASSNAKRLLFDIFHGVSIEYLQNYLDEFCYKFNRRNYGEGVFDRLLVTGVSYKNRFRYNIAQSNNTLSTP